jgi:hypothetical protein
MTFSPIPSPIQPIILHMYAYTYIFLMVHVKGKKTHVYEAYHPTLTHTKTAPKNPQTLTCVGTKLDGSRRRAGGARARGDWRTCRNALSHGPPKLEVLLTRCSFWRPWSSGGPWTKISQSPMYITYMWLSSNNMHPYGTIRHDYTTSISKYSMFFQS